MKHPDKSFTLNGKKYRRVINDKVTCAGCVFEGTTEVCLTDKTDACLGQYNSDGVNSIWVEVKKRGHLNEISINK